MDEKAPEPGVPAELEPGLRRILAPNASPMTHWGTNTYLLGMRDLCVVDPGPDDPEHLAAIRSATRGSSVSCILVTHAHRDHSPLAGRLAAETGAPVCGFGPPEAGRSTTMARLAAAGLAGGGEGVDFGFQPDRALEDGDVVRGSDWSVEAIHTPGHFAGHLSFALGDVVLTGDHVMGWASTLISPPDGDVAAFMASCEKLDRHHARVFHPGHGAPVLDPAERLDWLMNHRRSREAEILTALEHRPATPQSLAEAIYTDLSPALLPAATRNVFAHLIDLTDRMVARAHPELAETATFQLR